MPTNAAQNYVFEDFSRTEIAAPVTYTQEELDEACAKARSAGEHDAIVIEQRRQTASLETIAHTLTLQNEKAAAAFREYADELALASRALLSGLVDELIDARELAQIEATVRMFFANAAGAGKATLKLAPQSFDAHGPALIDALTQHKGVEMEIVADEKLSAGDCRIEWRMGAIERLRDHARAQISTIFQQPEKSTGGKANTK